MSYDGAEVEAFG